MSGTPPAEFSVGFRSADAYEDNTGDQTSERRIHRHAVVGSGRLRQRGIFARRLQRGGGTFLCEVIMTAFFLVIILGATHRNAPAGFAPIAIGLGLTLIHLISIPVTNTSVNPARSTGVALFAGSGAIGQLRLFWLAPIPGGLIGGFLYKWLGQDRN